MLVIGKIFWAMFNCPEDTAQRNVLWADKNTCGECIEIVLNLYV